MNKKTVGSHSVLLSIAGFDPSAGAGVVLDIKVFENLNFQGMGIITAVTAQNTREIKSIYNLSSQCLEAQFQTLSQDIQILGVKIGMIGSAENLEYIGKILIQSRGIPKVVDPVLQSSSGTWLLEKDVIPIYLNTIKEKASLITPNLEEARLLTGIKISNISQMQKAAETLFHSLNFPCLIKGGRFARKVTDLFFDGRQFVSIENEYIKKNVHGTGCFLSAGILAFLVKGASLKSACQQGIKLTHQAILQAIPVGQGQQLIKL